MKNNLLILGAVLLFGNAKSQDVIILKSGEELENVKIIDTLQTIVYKKDGIGKSIAKADIFMLKYANGKKVKPKADGQQTTVSAPAAQPVTQTAPPPQKKEPEPIKAAPQAEPQTTEETTTSSKILNDLTTKLKSEGGAEKFIPRKFGLGANISLLGGDNVGGSILMALSGKHFRGELEFGFAGASTFYPGISEEDEESLGVYKFGIGLYGMTQRGRVNLYIGPSFSILYAGNSDGGSGVFQIVPTFGAEYGLSNHFTIGGDVGIALNFGSDVISLNSRNRFIMRFYF